MQGNICWQFKTIFPYSLYSKAFRILKCVIILAQWYGTLHLFFFIGCAIWRYWLHETSTRLHVRQRILQRLAWIREVTERTWYALHHNTGKTNFVLRNVISIEKMVDAWERICRHLTSKWRHWFYPELISANGLGIHLMNDVKCWQIRSQALQIPSQACL